ncbi:SpoIID/LytB domain-containing protein [Baekduia soli]|uniref:SpoIID/LytB domain-containing protein n=1 Tax=Baekduia soli TaxID=496014 RepID=A0A5B8U4M8_9ACTN|nr:SpoIID/LytB domain-containing protein [Baekduia soli]QEC47927.1 SpoIID/LytB domain-containing protein [Baekduia soli]
MHVRRPPALATGAAIAALAAAPAAAGADVRIDGHGFGHAVGLSQYGAMGYAAREGRSWPWILAHYYPGTTPATAPATRLRVRLAAGPAARVGGVRLARDGAGRHVALSPRRSYRLTPWPGGVLLRLYDRSAGRVVAHLRAPVRLSGPGPLGLLGTADNGVADGRYRGALVVAGDPAGVVVDDDVDLEQYLLGVVGSEMPASWPTQALRAQAVAARTYALAGRRPAEPFDVYADSRSQEYRGVAGESPSAAAAVAGTRRRILDYGSGPAQTLFSASSGGRTAAVQDAFPGAAAQPYLQAVDDPYDTLSPYHDWSVSPTGAELEQRLGPVLAGRLADLAVTTTTPEGRAATVTVTGTLGTTVVDAVTIRRLLGLRSTWFTITRLPGA